MKNYPHFSFRTLWKSSLCIVLFFFLQFLSSAQSGVGLGVQLGAPSGITLKMYNPHSLSLEILGAWDSFRDSYFVNVHGLFEQELGRGPLHFFYGPGLFLGTEVQHGIIERGRVFVAGVSASVGANIYFAPFEVYGQITPRYGVAGQNNFSIGGGLGARFYFGS